MSPQKLLIAVFVLLAAILGGLWFLRDVSNGSGDVVNTPSLGPGTEALSRATSSSTLTRPGDDNVAGAPLEASRSEASGDSSGRVAAAALPEDGNIEEEGAHWLQVEIQSPPGTPGDDSLEILALAADEDSTDDVRSLVRRLALTRGFDRQRKWLTPKTKVAWTRRTVENGSTRVPLPPSASLAILVVDGRYLYLEEPYELDLGDKPSRVILDAELGGYAELTWKLPARAETRGVSQDEIEGALRLAGTFSFRQFTRTPPVSYEFDLTEKGPLIARGIPAGQLYQLSGEVPKLAPFQGTAVRFEPGERRTIEATFALGGEVAGLVTDEEGDPIAGATVSIGRLGIPFMLGQGPREVETSKDGSFRLIGVPAGEVILDAEASGWTDGKSESLTIADQESLEGIGLTLGRGASIAGSVRFADGRPAKNARIVARGEAQARGPWSRERQVGEGNSDAEGRFEITGLPEGRCDLVARLGREPAQDRGFRSLQDADETGESEADESPPLTEGFYAAAPEVEMGSQNVELVLEPLTTLTGRVVDETGAAITAFQITASPADNGGAPWATQGRIRESFEEREDGSFELWGVFDGEWTLQASAEGYSAQDEAEAQLSSPQTEAVELTLSRAATLAGRVVDPLGTPVRAQVIASAGRTAGWWQGGGDRTNSKADGSFELKNVPVGTLEVRAESTDWASSMTQTVEVGASEYRDDLVIELRVGGRITGEVFDAEGRPDPGRQVTYSENPMGGGMFGGGPSATTNEAGYFALEHVTPGTWIVSAGPSEEKTLEIMTNARDQSAFMDMFSKIDSTEVEIVDGGEVHVTLGSDPIVPVRIAGQVTRAGDGVEGAQVIALAEGGSMLKGMKMTQTQSDGSFEASVDRPGAYVFTVQQGGAGNQVIFPLDIPEVDEYAVALALPSGKIQGTVFSPEGEPLAGMRVSVTPEGESDGMRMGRNSATTNTEGSYLFDDLWPGKYTVRTNTNGAFGFGGDSAYATSIRSGIEVKDEQTTTGADLALTEASTVKGTVRDSEGTAIAGATIFVRDDLGRVLSTVSGIVTDAAGKFEYKGVAPGMITVSARAEGVASQESGPVRVERDASAEVALTLETSTTLVVEVVDREGEPQRARVRVWDENEYEVGNLMTMDALREQFANGFSTRESRIGPLPPGKYRVEATHEDGRSAKKPVTLKGQDERRVKLRLKD